MRTLNHNTAAQRLSILGRQNEKIFHIDDLANFWLINNRNTLRVTVGRYLKQGLLHRIYRGFYSLYPPDDLDPILLGAKAIHSFCYLSTETVLADEGYIFQKLNYCTFLSEKSLKFRILGHDFRSRKLKSKFLYNPEGTFVENGIKKATAERAICDMLYFNPRYHFDREINWKTIRAMQEKIGYPLTPSRYDFT